MHKRDSFALQVKDHENFFKSNESKVGKTMATCPDYAEHLNQMCLDKARLTLFKMEIRKRHPLFNTLTDEQLSCDKLITLESLADLYTVPSQLDKPFEANKTI